MYLLYQAWFRTRRHRVGFLWRRRVFKMGATGETGELRAPGASWTVKASDSSVGKERAAVPHLYEYERRSGSASQLEFGGQGRFLFGLLSEFCCFRGQLTIYSFMQARAECFRSPNRWQPLAGGILESEACFFIGRRL